MRTVQAEVASLASYQLAEGPVWDDEHERLVWVDISGGEVVCGLLRDCWVEVTGGHRFPGPVAAVVPTSDKGLLVALRRSFATIDPAGTTRTGPAVVPESTDSRFNDGACDPAGRFLIGSMAVDERRGTERLYRLDPAAGVEVLDDGFSLSNGLGWAPDGRTLYHVDSVPGIVWSRRYDPNSGAIGPRGAHLRIDDGVPDGLCVDIDGNLWVAVWGAGEVRCYAPDGGRVAAVEVPAPHTSSCAFVGSARDRLLITTARVDLPLAQLDAYPLSGRLFLAEVGARGVPTLPWAGRCADIT